jgi:hypothetical protein
MFESKANTDAPVQLPADVEAALRTIMNSLPTTKPGKDCDDDVYMIHAHAKRLLMRGDKAKKETTK